MVAEQLEPQISFISPIFVRHPVATGEAELHALSLLRDACGAAWPAAGRKEVSETARHQQLAVLQS